MPRPSKITQEIVERDERNREQRIKVGDAIVRALRAGAYFEDACEAAGVATSTGYAWLSRGQEHSGGIGLERDELDRMKRAQLQELARGIGIDPNRRKAELAAALAGAVPEAERPYVEFAEAVEKARAEAVVFNLALIRQAAQGGSWQAAAWYLERTRPEQYGRRIVESRHSGAVAFRPADVDLSALSDDELAQLDALMAKAGARSD